MIRLLAVLSVGLFLTLWIGGRDAGQTRLGLQGAYSIPALKDAPERTDPSDAPPAVDVAVADPTYVTTPPSRAATAVPAEVTQASFAPGGALAGGGLQTGMALSLPLVDTSAAAGVTGAAEAASEAPRIGRIVGSRVNVRAEPSAKATVLDRLVRDETVSVIGSDGTGWTHVRMEGDGIEGYVATRYLAISADVSALFPSQ